MSENFRLNKIKKDGGTDTELFSTALDAESAVYDLIDVFEADMDSPYKTMVIRDKNNDIIFKAISQADETWKVLINDTHKTADEYQTDDSIEVGDKKSSKDESLDESYMLIIEDPEIDDCAPGYFVVNNVDADSVLSTCKELPPFGYCNDGSLGDFLRADWVPSEAELPYGSCLDRCNAEEMTPGTIYCLDDCETQSPDEFFISKKNGEIQPKPMVVTEAAGESRARNYTPDALMPEITKMPEGKLVMRNFEYTFVLEDMQKVFNLLNISEEDMEDWKNGEFYPISSWTLEKAIRKACGYTGDDLSAAWAAMMCVLEENGYLFNDVGKGKKPLIDRIKNRVEFELF